MFAGIKSCKLEEFHKHSGNIFATYVSENVSYWPASVMLQACGILFSSESVLEALCEVSKKVTSPSGTWLGTKTGKVDIRTYTCPEEDHTHTGSTKAVLHFSTLLK